MAGAFAKSAFKSIEGSGASRAKKLADIYIKQHMTGTKVDSPEVYQYVIDNYLSPFADSLDVQKTIADYENKQEQLAINKQKVSGSLAALKLKEQGSWYVDSDEDFDTFRDPLAVAQDTSYNLDGLVAEAIMAKNEMEERNQDTSEITSYIYDLSKKADRMRSVVTEISNGGTGLKEGYGYYLDVDPNTGKIRGASFAPTDLSVKEAQEGKVRTDSKVKVGSASIPVYVSAYKNDAGEYVSKFGGTEYLGNSNLISGNDSEINLGDKNVYGYDGLSLERGKMYSAFTGETYQDGTPKKKFYYRGFDDSVYSFDENDPKGQELIDSMQAVGAIDKNNIPRINAYTALGVVSKPLSETTKSFSSDPKIYKYQQEAQQYQSEADRLNNLGFFGRIKENVKIATGNYDDNINVPNKPEEEKSATTESFIDKAKGFFKKRIGITSPTGGFANPISPFKQE